LVLTSWLERRERVGSDAPVALPHEILRDDELIVEDL
jgi:hypothetical protein